MKHYKNGLIYFLTMIITVVVYLVIHLYCSGVKSELLKEQEDYANNNVNQPVNNIISIAKEDNPIDDGGKKTPTPTPSSQDIYFEYDYDNDNYIYLINQFPIRDEVGKSLQGDKRTHDFKIKVNAKAEGVHYTIVAEKMDGNTLDDKWTKMYLVKDGGDIANCYRASNRIKTFNEYAKYQSNPKEAVIYEGIVSKSEALRGYIDYTFRMWVSEDLELQNSDYLSQSRTYRARINVYASKND